MKAVVVEVKAEYAALLQDDGSLVKLKNKNFTIGDVVNMKDKTIRRKGRFSTMVAAAAAMFFMMMGAGVWAYSTPYYVVSLDVNPSILMKVNMFERVIGMEAVNEDAAVVLEGLNLKNKDIEDAISQAVARIAEAGYLNEEGGNILIASVAKNNGKAERLAEKLREAAEVEAEENGVEPKISAEALGYNMVQQAKELGITPGKLNIITNLLGEVVGENDNVNDSIKVLMARFTATKGANGKARAEEAAGNAQKDEENGEPADNASLKELNAAGRAEQASKREGNASVDAPVSESNAPVLDKRPEMPEKPEVPVGKRP